VRIDRSLPWILTGDDRGAQLPDRRRGLLADAFERQTETEIEIESEAVSPSRLWSISLDAIPGVHGRVVAFDLQIATKTR